MPCNHLILIIYYIMSYLFIYLYYLSNLTIYSTKMGVDILFHFTMDINVYIVPI